MITLAFAVRKKLYKVEGLRTSALTPKLIEMGLYPGQEVMCMFVAPFGDPMAVNVGGYLLSLRKEEADLVLLQEESVNKIKEEK
jgi:Fe2+ transport system protein FeoA